MYSEFCGSFNISRKWPATLENIRAFVTWALSRKKLKPSTVKSYISSISTAQEMSGIKHEKYLSDKGIISALKGAENISFLEGEENISRLAMNIHLLNIFGHRLELENWSEFSKQTVWAAAKLSFFTSCRMGEILLQKECEFDAKTTLLWGNVKFMDKEEAIVYLPYTKTTGFKGAILDVFPSGVDSNCPVKALERLKKLAIENGSFDEGKPVFAFKSGKFLTMATFNKMLSNLLSDFEDERNKISCHSFRAAIPSAIASCPDKFKVSEVREWGRWATDTYKRYTRQERDSKRILFNKILSML